uniref:DLH domain-containing protein n=1 Tax=Heterorhabditis bacteriophora TaxID=37862 RepID=A0A1I7XUD4_HETBA
MRPLISERSSLLKRRLLAAVSALQTVEGVNQDKIGAIGFCFGGLCALDLARHRIGLKAAVSFHGTLTAIPELELDHIDTSIQVHHGDADPHIKAESVAEFMQEMRTRKADWSFISYGNAQHGFTEPRRIWKRSAATLTEKCCFNQCPLTEIHKMCCPETRPKG